MMGTAGTAMSPYSQVPPRFVDGSVEWDYVSVNAASLTRWPQIFERGQYFYHNPRVKSLPSCLNY